MRPRLIRKPQTSPWGHSFSHDDYTCITRQAPLAQSSYSKNLTKQQCWLDGLAVSHPKVRLQSLALTLCQCACLGQQPVSHLNCCWIACRGYDLHIIVCVLPLLHKIQHPSEELINIHFQCGLRLLPSSQER